MKIVVSCVLFVDYCLLFVVCRCGLSLFVVCCGLRYAVDCCLLLIDLSVASGVLLHVVC